VNNFFWVKTVNVTQGITPPLVFTAQMKAELAKQVRISSFELEAVTKAQPRSVLPVDTGNMRDSINQRGTDDPLVCEVGDFNEKGDPEYDGYAIYQELGTSRMGIAHHFLGGSAMKIADKFFDAVAKAVGGKKSGEKQTELVYFEGSE
jgi:hypothetical protein